MRSTSIRTALVLSAALAQWSTPVAAQQPTHPPKCTAAEYRQFDFWIGDWDVSATGSDVVIAHSRVEKIVGCHGGQASWGALDSTWWIELLMDAHSTSNCSRVAAPAGERR